MPLTCTSAGGLMSATGSIMERPIANIVWALIALSAVAFACVCVLPANHNWDTRAMTDPMIISHVMIVFPIAAALHLRMHATAGLLAVSGVVSLMYHAFREENTALAATDAGLATFVFFWVLAMLATSLTMCPDREVLLMIGALLVLAMTFYFAGAAMREGDGKDCFRWRTHPLWHILAYAGVALVIVNFNKAWARAPGNALSRRRWVRDLQRFDW